MLRFISDHFKKKLLLPAADREKLQDDAVQMYNNFCKDDAYDYVDLGTDLLSQFKQCMLLSCDSLLLASAVSMCVWWCRIEFFFYLNMLNNLVGYQRGA